MPKRQKVRFTLDRDYAAMLRKVMEYDGWKGTASAYCAYQMRRQLAADIVDLSSAPDAEIETSDRLFALAKSDFEREG